MYFAIISLVTQLAPVGADANISRDLSLVLSWDPQTICMIPLEKMEAICSSFIADSQGIDQAVMRKIYMRRAETRILLDNCAGAIEDIEHLLKNEPNDVAALVQLARAHLTQKDNVAKAAQIARQLTKEHPDFAKGYYLAGACAFERRQYTQALDMFNEAIKRDNTHMNSFWARANVNKRLERYRESVADLDRALSLPDHPKGIGVRARLHRERAFALSMLGEEYRARSSLMRARMLDPNDYLTSLLLWDTCFILDEYGNCVELGRELVNLRPKESKGYQLYAHSLLIVGDLDRASQMCEKATTLDANNRHAWTIAGMIYFRKSEYAKAFHAFGRAHSLDPSNPDNACRSAFFFASCPDGQYRNSALAKRLTNVDITMFPVKRHRHLVLMVRAIAQAESGEFPQAVQTVKKAIKEFDLDPTSKRKCEQLADLFAMKTRYRYDPSRGIDHVLFELPATVRIGEDPEVKGLRRP